MRVYGSSTCTSSAIIALTITSCLVVSTLCFTANNCIQYITKTQQEQQRSCGLLKRPSFGIATTISSLSSYHQMSLGMSSSTSSTSSGVSASPAANFEEDLQLTLKIILDHVARSTTVSKDQFVSQMEEIKKIKSQPVELQVPIDVSVPYDAAALLAYDVSDKSLSFDDFKLNYETEAVAAVVAKRQPPKVTTTTAAAIVDTVVDVDISVPYDAAAQLAYEATDKSISFLDFKAKYEADAVASVIAKRPPVPVTVETTTTAQATPAEPVVVVDISVPYDAAAQLAYEASDKTLSFVDFKVNYEADAVASVIAKRPVPVVVTPVAPVETVIDITVPYDAAAQLAYNASDKSMSFTDFKTKYETDAVASVISKRPAPVVAVTPAPVVTVEAVAVPAEPVIIVDISVPYDAAAQLAYDASDKSMSFVDFKTQYETDAVASVIAKRPVKVIEAPAPVVASAATATVAVSETTTVADVDISVPYDAAAKLAYEASDKSKSYPDFKIKYELEAVASIIAKRMK